MSSFTPGTPLVGEYSPSFDGYITNAREFSDPVEKLELQLTEALTLLTPLTADVQLHRYAPDKWSVKEVLGHMADAERIFAYRALRIARNDQTPLPGFDENEYVNAAETDGSPWQELLDEFSHVRQASILLLRHLSPEAWLRMGTSNNFPTSVRALAYIMIGHVAHHLEILRTRYTLV